MTPEDVLDVVKSVLALGPTRTTKRMEILDELQRVLDNLRTTQRMAAEPSKQPRKKAKVSSSLRTAKRMATQASKRPRKKAK